MLDGWTAHCRHSPNYSATAISEGAKMSKRSRTQNKKRQKQAGKERAKQRQERQVKRGK